jgi:hypothetical protein
MVDTSREEHRMMIFSNDSDSIQSDLIQGDDLANGMRSGKIPNGILTQKIHTESYTVTLYALLKNYGLIPVVRIKPRIRFRRSNYDNLSSSAPLCYGSDDIVQFAELKRGDDTAEGADYSQLAQFFGDAPAIENLSADPALQLVSQRDLFLRQPPFKVKTKVFGAAPDQSGIPIGSFLDALNDPKQTEAIFKQFPSGDEFALDLLEALEPFGTVEFQFGLYSRYERLDCVLAGSDSGGYRTTFDPFTALGYIQSEGPMQQLQILAHERGTRWEHKILIDQLSPSMLNSISNRIRMLRRKYLIGRLLSKSQTGLTALADSRESRLGLTKDLLTGYQLTVEVSMPKNRMSNIESRKKLRECFTGNSQYQLHPFNKDITERHLNVAKGVKNGVVYSLDNAYLTQSIAPSRNEENGVVVVRDPIGERMLIRSAQELRERIPTNGFDECWNEMLSEAGYTVVNQQTARCYAVSYQTQKKGGILDGQETIQKSEHFLSVRYLGVSRLETALRHDRSDHRSGNGHSSLLEIASQKEIQVIQEMKNLISYLKTKHLI